MEDNHRLNGKEGKGKLLTPVNVFCFSSLVGLTVLLLCFFFSRGELIDNYFFYDTLDAGMDFFHCLEYVNGRTPYKTFNTLYPPLGNLIFYVLYRFIPKSVVSEWPKDFNESVKMRGTNLDLRVHQAPFLIFIAFILLTSILIFAIMMGALQHLKYSKAFFASTCMLLSPGILFAIDRGNIVFLTFLFILAFLYFRNSPNPILRELSLLSLAIAAGMKLYPAFFGILLLRDKQYKRAARAILYGILCFILPAFCFKEGLSAIATSLTNALSFTSTYAMVWDKDSAWTGTGFESILFRIAHYLELAFHAQIDTEWFRPAALLITVFLLLSSIIMRNEWQSVFAVSMAVIMFANQSNYIIMLYLLPLLFFLMKEDRLCKQNVVPFISMVIMSTNLPLFYTVNKFFPSFFVYHVIALVVVTWCIVEFIQNIKSRIDAQNSKNLDAIEQ